MIQTIEDLKPGVGIKLHCGCEGLIEFVTDSLISISKWKIHGNGQDQPSDFGVLYRERFALALSYHVFFHKAQRVEPPEWVKCHTRSI